MTTTGRDLLPTEVEDPSFVTACGRRIAVRCLRLAPADRPIGRVALDVGRERGGVPGTWAALTADEARALARLLLLQAGLVEGGEGPGEPSRQGVASL
ncbi:hypothetical protein [Streptomyces prasinopilosus]|uniref:Uncharacterized protein n=1 Tax=Streptomyces prasinopilosus TaxID=67344 RepID=A0A1G6WIU3_9ACTN|nr:hypothetical protein [Streptomyces prasinopilosus]SDD65718.1 hypothetical protein SAMN05216505_110118 [Streptomyces prasinopilosus]